MKKKRRPQPGKASAAAMLAWSWLSRKVGACARMGRVQGGARAAFAVVCKRVSQRQGYLPI